jgi:RNA polymerase sigma-70 factor (ECF subfamily)
MAASETTCWTVIEAAARGGQREREFFAQSYLDVIGAYLNARWRNSALLQDIDDAAQEVFVECFRDDGALNRADRSKGGFRPFLFGVVRNVARRFENRRAGDLKKRQSGVDLDAVSRSDAELSRVFDRAWAQSTMRRAAERQAELAQKSGEAAIRRVELLRLRFHEGLAIREIAARWGQDTARLHHEYASARQEFKKALLEVIAFHLPGSPEEVEQDCAALLDKLN